MKNLKKLLTVLLTLAMLLSCCTVAFAADKTQVSVTLLPAEDGAAGRDNLRELTQTPTQPEDPDAIVRVSIILEQPSTVDKGFSTINIAGNSAAMAYRNSLETTQANLQKKIETQVLDGAELDVVWNLTLAANLISANVRAGDIEKIEALPGVKSVHRELVYLPDVASNEEYNPDMATSEAMIGSSAAWSAGYYGAGSRIAIVDTGLDTDHQSFDPKAFDYAISKYPTAVSLMQETDISKVLTKLNAYQHDSSLKASDLYRSTKTPYGYNYADHSLEITHDYDAQGSHGSHVAGIAAANRFISDGNGGYVDALESAHMQGVAPDAQILVMKVFGKTSGATESDYMAAIEDAIFLDADSVNLSLGGSPSGYTYSSPYVDFMNSLTKSDTVVVFSAGNKGNWAEQTTNNAKEVYGTGYLYSDDVSFQTSGAPGTYTTAFSVASVDNIGYTGTYLEHNGSKLFYHESATFGNPAFTTIAGTYDFVYLDSIGVIADGDRVVEDQFALLAKEIDLNGKILVCNRGSSSFLLKVHAAVAQGAVGVLIANNVDEPLTMDLTGYTGHVPAATISVEEGALLRDNKAGIVATTYDATGAAGDTTVSYYTGKLTVSSGADSQYGQTNDRGLYTISSFSSWGVPGDLSLKPEIAAPGGNIYSVNGVDTSGKAYENMSGTSMSAPQVAGMAALLSEYAEKTGMARKAGVSERALALSLLMSTAVPLRNAENGNNYHSVLSQGSGMANIGNALSAKSFIQMSSDATDTAADGKVKVELGDDPLRKGSYDYSFTLQNLTNTERSYTLSTDLFTQAIWYDKENSGADYLDTWTVGLGGNVTYTVGGKTLTPVRYEADVDADGDTDADDAQAVLDYLTGLRMKEELNLEVADVDQDGTVTSLDAHLILNDRVTDAFTLPANGSVTIRVHIEVDKEQLERYPKGAYIEGYTYVDSVADAEGVLDVSHSIPILGFYGNWTDPSMYDCITAEQLMNDDYDRLPYLTGTTGGDTNYVILNIDGQNYYLLNGDSITSGDVISGVTYSLIRNADSGIFRITDHNNPKKVYYTSPEITNELLLIGAYYYDNAAVWDQAIATLNVSCPIDSLDLPDDAVLDLTLIMAPEYYADADGSYDWEELTDGELTETNRELGKGAYLTTTVYVDKEAPKILDVRAEHDAKDGGNLHIYVDAQDNRGVMDIALFGDDGDRRAYEYNPSIYVLTPESPELLYKPCFEPSGPNEKVSVEFDGYYTPSTIADEMGEYPAWPDVPYEELKPGVYSIQVADGAGNRTVRRLFVETEQTNTVTDVEIYFDGEKVGEDGIEIMLGGRYRLMGRANPMTLSDRSVTWKSDDPSIADVDGNGIVTGVKGGTTTLTATSVLNPDVSANVQVTVKTIDKVLNAMIWNEEGKFCWGAFNTGDPSVYQSFGTTPYNFIALGYGPDNKLYGATRETNDEGATVSDFYSINTDTYAVKHIGGDDSVGYVDLAETHSLGENMVAVYGNMILVLDINSGEAWGAYEMTSEDDPLIGIAYEGTMQDSDYGLTWDWYLLIDNQGNIYEEALAYDGTDFYAWYADANDSLLGNTGYSVNSSTFYRNSAYYDGEQLFWSRYSNGSTYADLIAIDFSVADETHDAPIYNLGAFGEDVYPVMGLVDFSGPIKDRLTNNVHTGSPEALHQTFTAAPESYLRQPEVGTTRDGVAPKDLTKNPNALLPDARNRSAEPEDGTVAITVNGGTTNGRATLTYNPELLTLEDVAEYAGCFSYGEEQAGVIEIAYADRRTVAGEAAVFTFRFRDEKNTPRTALTLETHEAGRQTALTGVTETIYVGNSECYVDDFVDCPSAWYHEAIDYVRANGLMYGDTDRNGNATFRPADNLSRMEAVTVLHRLAGSPTPKGPHSFADVPLGVWYLKALHWAVEQGIINGIGDNKIAPDAPITREQLATILWRSQGKPEASADLSGFTDAASISSYAKDAMVWAVSEGIFRGDNGRLKPTDPATRAEYATIMMRYLGGSYLCDNRAE